MVALLDVLDGAMLISYEDGLLIVRVKVDSQSEEARMHDR